MTTAQLGFAIDSSPASKAASDLGTLISAAQKTETAVDRMGESTARAITKISGAGAGITQRLRQVANDTENLAARINRAMNIGPALGGADRGKDIQEYGRQLDTLRGKFNPVFAVLQTYKNTLGEIRQAQRLGAISADEMAAAISRERQASLASISALKGRQQAMGGKSSGGGSFQTANIAAQFQDVAVTSAMGMSPLQIALQQGTQLSSVLGPMGATGAVKGLGAAFSSLFSLTSLGTLGFVALGAAAIQWGMSAINSIEGASTAFEKHEEYIKRIKGLYDEAAESGVQYGQRTQAAIAFTSNQDRIGLDKALQTGINTFTDRVTPKVDASQYEYAGADIAGIGQQMMRDQFGPFTDIVSRFVDEARRGKGDVLELNKEVQDLANTEPSNKAMQKLAATILGYAENATKAAESIKELNDQQRDFTLMMSRTTAAANATKYQADNTYQAFDMTRRYNADVAGIGARSPRDIAAAERRRLEAEPIDPKEDPANRGLRINQQSDLAYRKANQSIIDAQKERSRNLDKILQDQQTDIDMIGKTGGAATALRKEYELTSALRMDAARQGIEVDQKELDLIKERAAALGQLTDQYNQSKFTYEMKQQASDARLSPRDRQISTTLRQYGLPEDMQGANASAIGQQYDWQQAKDMAKGFGSAFSNELVSGSHDIGESFLKGFQSAIDNQATKLWEKFFDSASNIFADLITGGNGSGASAGGLVGSVAAAVSGKAANDNASGAFSGLGKIMPVTSAPLGPVTGSGDSLAWNFWKSKGLPDHQVAGILGNIKAESAFNPSAIGDAGAAKGLYQWNDRAPKMLGAVGADWKNNPLAQHEFAYSELMGPENKAWQALTSAKSTREATAAFAGFERPRGFSWKNPEGAHNFSGRYAGAESAFSKFGGTGGADTSVDAVNNLAAASKEATVNLGGFGSGLDKMGKSLATAFPAAPAAPGQTGGSAGFGGWLGSLFGGGGLSSADIAKYTPMTGLFADGTNYAPGGMAIVGERGPELVNLPQGAQVFNTNKSAQMMKGSGGGQGGSQRPIQNFYLDGARGDDHIRELARQGAQEGVAQYHENQVTGGYGDTQKQYNARVG